MLNKEWKILNHKHQNLNKFKYLHSKFKTNLSKQIFIKERFAVFVIGILVIGYCLGFRIPNLGFISLLNKQLRGELS